MSDAPDTQSEPLEPVPLPVLTPFEEEPLEQACIIAGGRAFEVYHTDASDHIFRLLKNSGRFYEADFLAAIARHVAPGDLVVDAGANIGNHTLFFAGLLGCRVAAFEPGARTLRLLQHNVLANGLSGSVEVYPFALAAERSRFSSHGNLVKTLGLGALTLRHDPGGDMHGLPLDAVSFDRPVKLLKVDVEGMELDVVRGARETLLRDRPVICVECDDIGRFNRLFDDLCDLGFLAIETHNFTPTHVFVPVDKPSTIEIALSREVALRYIAQRQEVRGLQERLAKVEGFVRRIQLVSQSSSNAPR